ncbi:MAG TPA: type II toxin-antitoxin system RelE/ParE family toxin [Gemmatimonadales bacterium]
MIRSFRDRDTARLFRREPARKWGPDVRRSALRKLRMLDAATVVADLLVLPGNRLEKLTGKRDGQWSIRVNDQWRLCFRWNEGEAHDVEIVDYH